MTKHQIKQILRAHKKQALKCLYPEDDWAWGSTKKNRKNSVELMRSILKDIPLTIWPEKSEKYFDYNYLTVNDGNWRLDLFRGDEGEYFANLIYAKDDHTAWVVLEKNKWVDFDIGGS